MIYIKGMQHCRMFSNWKMIQTSEKLTMRVCITEHHTHNRMATAMAAI